MKIQLLITQFVCILVMCSNPAAADSIQLRDGRHLQGKYIGGTTTMIGFMTSGAIEYFATADVLALMFDNSEAPLNGLPPNHLNGSSSWQAQTGLRTMRRGLPTKKWQPARSLKCVNAVLPAVFD